MLNELMTFLPEADKPTGGLFPGLGSSAFDEHKTNKQAPPSVDKIKRQIERLNSLTSTAVNNRNSIRKVFHAGNTWGAQAPNHQALSEMPWIDKYPLTKQDLRSTTVDTSSPKFNRLERIIGSYETALEQAERYTASIKRLKSKMLRVRKQEAEKGIKDRSASIPKVAVDVDKMLRTFHIAFRTERWATPKSDDHENPYFLRGAGKTAFAGHPAHFTEWKGKLRTMFYELEKWVKELGHPELDMMYASAPNNNVSWKTDDFLRYYITNKDGSVVIVNDRFKKIHVYVKSPNLPASELPIRWRMRRLRVQDIEWLDGKLRLVKVKK